MAAGELSTANQEGTEKGTLSNWLLRGAAKRSATAAPTVRVLFDAATLSEPVSTVLAFPHNFCYLNALVQALLWLYQARPSARTSEFGDLHALLRPLLSSGTAVQLHRRKAWIKLLETWPNPQQQHDTAELLAFIKRRLRFPAIEGSWEARTLQGPHHNVHQCATQVPHLMLPCQSNKTLQELVEQWAFHRPFSAYS